MSDLDRAKSGCGADRQVRSAIQGDRRGVLADCDGESPTVPQQAVEYDSTELAGEAGGQLNRVGIPAHSGVAVDELLEETTDAGHEREDATAAGLRELVEVVADERLLAALRVHEAGAPCSSQC